ncbi:MAG: hypothetical protein Q9227_001708 [Pyrenula ochraceoflavens]
MTQNQAARVQRLPPPPPSTVPSREPFRQNVNARIGQTRIGGAQVKEVVDLTGTAADDMVESPAKRRKLSPGTTSFGLKTASSDQLSDNNQKHREKAGAISILQAERKVPDSSTEDVKAVQPSSPSPSQDSSAQSLPPLPGRPWRTRPREPLVLARHEKDRSIPRREVQTTPYSIAPPQDAPIMKEDVNLADFFPWKSSHPEDNLTREAVREGYFDKTKLQNETSTARPSLLGVSHGKASSTSSFKPPPRVTLTEAKRKSWLSDLSNPTVPLRRLSRTIPQGIRGQQLLDQCLSNAVPVGRAIWFVKCVGANEIRTLKRKGTSATLAVGSEAKWLKEWTGNVEAFVEGILINNSAADWKLRLKYCVEVATRLYRENLLDREHYLDWIVRSIHKTSLDQFPAWMLLTRIHSRELGSCRGKGRLLAEALLGKLQDAYDTDSEIFKPFVQKTSQFIRSFVLAQPSCFLLPRVWDKYSATLASCLHLNVQKEKALFDTLVRRNMRIQTPQPPDTRQVKSWRRAVIDVLDDAKAPCEVPTLAFRCSDFQSDPDKLIRVILEWATTSFRIGLARMYLAVRLLRRWQKKGIDIQTPICCIISEMHPHCHLQYNQIRRIVSELMRSQSFSLSRYLQWLTARGALPDLKRPDIRLLLDVPIHCVPGHVRNLRNTILTRAGFSVASETRRLDTFRSALSRSLPKLFLRLGSQATEAGDVQSTRGKLSGSSTSEVSSWIRSCVRDHYVDPPKKGKGTKEGEEISKLTLPEFELVRDTLEEFGDLAILADVLSDACNSENEAVLAAAADTLCHHLDALWMIGAFEDLHSALFEAYQRLRSSNTASKNLVVSLAQLSSRKPFPAVPLSMLRQDLARGERSVAVAACSPISDHMADSLQQAGSTFSEEFDQVLSAGNSIDDQTMASLFSTLTSRLESTSRDAKNQDEIFCQMLCRLKAFRVRYFDTLMIKWIRRLLQAPSSSMLPSILPPLIAFNCSSFGAIFAVAKELLSVNTTNPGVIAASNVRLGLSQIFTLWQQAPSASTSSVWYRFRHAKHQCLKEHPIEALELLPWVDISGVEQMAQEMLISSLVHDLSSLTGLQTSLETANLVSLALERLLLSTYFENTGTASERLRCVIEGTNEFSLPLVQLYLSLRFKQDDSRESLSTIIMDLVLESVNETTPVEDHWLPLISGLGTEAAQLLCQKADGAFLALSSPYALPQSPTRPNAGFELPREDTLGQATQLIFIITSTAYGLGSVPTHTSASVGPAIVEKLGAYLRWLNTLQNSTLHVSEVEKSSEKDLHLTFLSRLLKFVSLHQDSLYSNAASGSAPVPSSKADSQASTKILFTLLNIALHPILNSSIIGTRQLERYELDQEDGYEDFIQYILDVAAVLVDTASPDSVALVSRYLKDKARDPRIEFLIGGTSLSPGSTFNQERVGTGNASKSGFTEEMQHPLTLLAIRKDSDVPGENMNRVETPKLLGEWRPRQWELLEGGNEPSIGLGLFDATWGKEKSGMSKVM